MTTLSHDFAELSQLIGHLADDDLGEADHARLVDILRSDAAARAYYLDTMEIHARLTWKQVEGQLENLPSPFGSMADTNLPSPACERGTVGEGGEAMIENIEPLLPIPYSVLRTPYSSLSSLLPTTPLGNVAFSYAMSAVLVAIGLFIFSLMSASSPNNAVVKDKPINPQNHTTSNAPTPEPQIVSIARITGTVDCVWANTDYAPVHNRVVKGAKFMLKSGLMEITYYTGAKVILQGPCTYEVESAAGGYLSLGKLTARVEKKSGRVEEGEKGRLANSTSPANLASSSTPPLPLSPPPPLFTVRTPAAIVTDLGTEFGVEVSKEGISNVRVFSGKVELAFQGVGDSARKALPLTAGQMVRVDTSGSHPITKSGLQSMSCLLEQFPIGGFSCDFSKDAHDIVLNGNASILSDHNQRDATRLRLTDNQQGRTGSAWHKVKQSVANGFSTDFTFSFSGGSGGGEGMAFVIQNSPESYPDANECGVYDHALNICFDSHRNPDLGEFSDAMLIIRTGRTFFAKVDLEKKLGMPSLCDSKNHAVHIDYTPGRLDVYLDHQLVAQATVDLKNLVEDGSVVDGDGKAWVGFGARSRNENHDVLAWKFVAKRRMAQSGDAAAPAIKEDKSR